MSELRLVLFDLDDTLYPERDFVLSGFRAVAEAWSEPLGVPPRRLLRLCLRLFREDARRVFDRLLALTARDRLELAPELVRTYREHRPALCLPDWSDRALTVARSRWRIGLVSDGDPGVQRRKLHALGIADCFEWLMLTGEHGPDWGKPSPRPFLAAAAHFGIRPEQAAYLADNPAKDFRGPNEIGMRSVRVRRPRGVYAHLEPAPGWGPTVTVASLTEALTWLDQPRVAENHHG